MGQETLRHPILKNSGENKLLVIRIVITTTLKYPAAVGEA